MIRKFLFMLLFSAVLFFQTHAQEKGVIVGEVSNGVYILKDNQAQLVKAFEWTFRDGTKVSEMKVEQLGNGYFLVAYCTYQGKKRMAAVDLDQVGINFVLNEDAVFKSCSAVACENCRFFLENNKIVACKCEETGTISNHCHYKSAPGTGFYANFQRALRMSND